MCTFELTILGLMALVYLIINTGVCYVLHYWFKAD